MPGDRIRLSDKQLIRNGEPIEEPYVLHKTSYTDDYRDNFPVGKTEFHRSYERASLMLDNHMVDGEIVVPPDSFFVLGDNRDQSLDSRYWGFVPEENVIGRPVMVYWSYDPPIGEAPDQENRRGEVRCERIFHLIGLEGE